MALYSSQYTSLKQPVSKTSSGAYFSPAYNQPVARTSTGAQYSPAPKVLNASTSPSTSTKITTGGGMGAQAPVSTGPSAQDVINQNTQSLESILENDYNQAISDLNAQEADLRGQAGSAEQSIKSSFEPVKTAIGQEQQTRQAGLTAQEQKAESQRKSSLQQARDLFRQTQQSNIAQLSALGLSSSSVMEGLAEKLGVETARRLGGVNQSTDEIVQNIAKERSNVDNYYKQKITDLEGQMQSQIGQIQQSLISGIRQIQQAKNQAATDKANRRTELMMDARNKIFALQQQAQEYQQSIERWRQQKNAALQEAQQFVVTPQDFSALNQAQQNIMGITGVGGQLAGYQPTYSISPTGKFTTTVSPRKDLDNEDPMARINKLLP